MSSSIKRLGDFAEAIMGQAPPGECCNKSGLGTPFVKAGEFGKERPIIREWTTKPLKLAKFEDVLLCVVGATCGKINKGADCAIGRSVAAIRADQSRLNSSYLYHFLSSWTDRLRAMSQGAAQTVISKEMIEGLKIPIIPLEEQKRIATILDKADAIRRKRQQTIKLANEFLRSTFLEMFGDPVTNPKGIRKTTIGELIKVSSGNGLISADMKPSGGFAVYGGNGINGRHSEYMFNDPQIVIGRVGVYCGVVHITEPKSWVTDNALYVKEYLEKININYLHEALKLAKLNQYAGQAAQPLVSGERIYRVPILVPSQELQQKFSDISEKINKVIGVYRTSLNESEAMFDSLKQRAFTAQL